MRNDRNSVKASLYAGVRELPVNDIQRAIAVDTLEQAEKVSEAIVSVLGAGRRLFTRAAAGTGGLSQHH